MEVTIQHKGGTTTVSEFTRIEGARDDLKVWYGEPSDENSTFNLYADGYIEG